MKKLFLITISLLILVGCSNTSSIDKSNIDESKMIEPVNNVVFMEGLDSSTREMLLDLSENYEVDNDFFSMIGYELPNIILKDIDGNDLDLASLKGKKVIFEVAGTWCSSCQEQTKEYMDEIVANYPDVTFVQYFEEGHAEDIENFYFVTETNIPENIIILQKNEDLNTWLFNIVGIKYLPSFLMFDDTSKITWVSVGTTNLETVKKIEGVAFNKELDLLSIENNEGKTFREVVRTWKDVRKDMPESFREGVKKLGDDQYLEEAVYSNLGKYIDFDKTVTSVINDEEVDMTNYKDGNILINFWFTDNYGNLIDNSEEIKIVNEFLDGTNDVKTLNILVAYDEEAKTYYDNLEAKPKGTTLGSEQELPDDFYNIEVYSNPTSLFVKDGYIKGVLSGGYTLESLNSATNLFFK